MTRDAVFARLRTVFLRERAVCRVIAAWLFAVTLVLIRNKGYFFALSYAQNNSVFAMLGFLIVFFLLLSAAAYFLPKFHTDSWALFLAATVCMAIWILMYYGWYGELFFAFAVAVAYSMVVVYCFRANEDLLGKWKPGKKTLIGFAIGVGLLTFGIIAAIGCLRYRLFYSPNFDFGLFCNMFYNMAETGRPLSTSERDVLLSHFAVHISPVYYLILPFYYVFRSPMTLQIAQAAVLALGVIPVVLLARHFKLSAKTTMLMAALYAFYPALTKGTYFDLHENCFLPLLLLLTFFFYEKRRWIWMYVCAALVLSVKEDAAICLFVFAIFILLSERNWLHGSILAAVSVGYFLLCGYLLTHFGEGMMTTRFSNLIYEKDGGLSDAIKTALVNPGFLFTQLFANDAGTWEKLIYVLQLLLPIGALPLCTKRASRWILMTPMLINLLTMYPYQYQLDFQYHFGITAFLFYAAIKNLPELHLPTAKTLLRIGAAVCCALYLAVVGSYLASLASVYAQNRETYAQMERFLDEHIPEDASVAASTFLIPYLSERDEIYEVYYHGQKTDIEYVVFDIRYEESGYGKDLKYYVSNGYELVAELKDTILILQKTE